MTDPGHYTGENVPRVLLGVPGNHDWCIASDFMLVAILIQVIMRCCRYDGLQGFSRLFRYGASAGLVMSCGKTLFERIRDKLLGRESNNLEPDEDVKLVGYTPLQSASYWALPAAPDINLIAIDRMLKERRVGKVGLLDSRQVEFFKNDCRFEAAIWISSCI